MMKDIWMFVPESYKKKLVIIVLIIIMTLLFCFVLGYGIGYNHATDAANIWWNEWNQENCLRINLFK